MKKVLLTVILLAVQGCATERYIVDTKGVDSQAYKMDLAECEQYRKEVDNTETAVNSVGLAAVMGGIIGAILGDSDSAAELAGSMAVQVGAGVLLGAEHEKDEVVKSCLKQRGYKVLN